MRVFLCAAVALLAAPANARLMGATELKVDVLTKGLPSSRPVADIYYLVGEVGAKETYTLTGKGPASITLFGPDGSEILTAAGSGTVKLEVVLPFTDVYTLAVARRTRSLPYTLGRRATLPTLAEAYMASNVGYEFRKSAATQCWLRPGVKLRINSTDGTQESTLAADRATVSYVWRGSKGTIAGDKSYKIVDGQIRETVRTSDGKVTYRDSFNLTYNSSRLSKFTGYFCKD